MKTILFLVLLSTVAVSKNTEKKESPTLAPPPIIIQIEVKTEPPKPTTTDKLREFYFRLKHKLRKFNNDIKKNIRDTILPLDEDLEQQHGVGGGIPC